MEKQNFIEQCREQIKGVNIFDGYHVNFSGFKETHPSIYQLNLIKDGLNEFFLYLEGLQPQYINFYIRYDNTAFKGKLLKQYMLNYLLINSIDPNIPDPNEQVRIEINKAINEIEKASILI